MPNGLVFECHLNTGQPNHLNTGQMAAILFLMYWSGARMVRLVHMTAFHLNTKSFEIRTSKSWYSNVSGIQMVGIQIPTVFSYASLLE